MLKFSALLAIALFMVWLIVVGLLYGVLDGSGVIGKINDTVTTINGPGSTAPISTGVVFSAALVVGAVSAVLFILLSTIGVGDLQPVRGRRRRRRTHPRRTGLTAPGNIVPRATRAPGPVAQTVRAHP